MRRHTISKMSRQEILKEIGDMDATIKRLDGAQDATGKFQLQSARALKFALECKLRGLNPHADQVTAPGALPSNVVSLAEFKAKRDANASI